jgi:hypothetical protein
MGPADKLLVMEVDARDWGGSLPKRAWQWFDVRNTPSQITPEPEIG